MNSLIKFNPLFNLNEFDRIFDPILEQQGWNVSEGGFPRVEQKATENDLTIQFALAGYPKDSLKVEVKDDTLTVKGDKIQDEKNLFASRAFTWSRKDVYSQWALEKAEITHENGALTIVIPKKEEKKPKLLEIK